MPYLDKEELNKLQVDTRCHSISLFSVKILNDANYQDSILKQHLTCWNQRGFIYPIDVNFKLQDLEFNFGSLERRTEDITIRDVFYSDHRITAILSMKNFKLFSLNIRFKFMIINLQYSRLISGMDRRCVGWHANSVFV